MSKEDSFYAEVKTKQSNLVMCEINIITLLQVLLSELCYEEGEKQQNLKSNTFHRLVL